MSSAEQQKRTWPLTWLGVDPPWSEERRARLEILRRVPRVSPKTSAVLAVFLAVQTASGVATKLATGFVIGSVPAAMAAGFGSPASRLLGFALAVKAAVFLVDNTVPVAVNELAAYLGQRVDLDLRLELLDRMNAPVGIAHLEDPAIRDEVARAGGVGLFTPGAAVHGMTGILSARLSTLGSFVLVAWFRWWLAAGLLLAYQVIEVRARDRYMETARVVYGQTQDFRRSDYMKGLGTGLATKETRVFGMADWVVDRFRASWLRAMAQVWADRTRATWHMLWTAPLLGLIGLWSFWVVGSAAIDGDLDLGQMATLVSAVGGVGAFMSYGLQRTRTEYGVTAYRPLLTLSERVAARAPALHGRADPGGMPSEVIRFENVSFRYEGRDTDVYAGLDLDIPAGRSLAIVGANGAGKTTLCKLLARCYEPSAGRIVVDGVDLRDIDARAWQRRVAAIFQDYVGFPLTAADNIGFGAVQRLDDRASLEESARRAGVLDVIEALPFGWDTVLDRRFDSGAEVSGGQWQRVALARALFAVGAGAGLLILDEPTAALDVRGEAELFERYLELTRGVTSILVSHRFSTVRRADRIAVLEAGRVTEQGTHDELIALGGTYARMFALQASRYAEDDTRA